MTTLCSSSYHFLDCFNDSGHVRSFVQKEMKLYDNCVANKAMKPLEGPA